MSDRITVREIAAGGDGVGTLPDGAVVFIPRTAPGDQVTLTAVTRQARFARGVIDQLLLPGPDRVAPPCPHYQNDQCGSCQLMHLSASAQSQAKSRIAGAALRRIGGFQLDDPPIVPAIMPLGYRTRIKLHLRNGRLGYFGRDGVFQLQQCLLAIPAVQELHAALLPHQHLLPGSTAEVMIRADPSGGMHLVVTTGRRAEWGRPADLYHAIGMAATLWWQRRGEEPRWVAGQESTWPVSAFEQVDPVMGGLIRKHALEALDLAAGELTWDLYSGVGETTRQMAAAGARVQSVELDASAVALADRLGPAGPRRLIGDAAVLAPRLDPPARIIANPPRAGMDQAVTTAILRSGAARVAIISCHPATLARDLRRLGERYQISSVTAFDLFPQTAHLEVVAVLDRS